MRTKRSLCLKRDGMLKLNQVNMGGGDYFTVIYFTFLFQTRDRIEAERFFENFRKTEGFV